MTLVAWLGGFLIGWGLGVLTVFVVASQTSGGRYPEGRTYVRKES